MSQQQREAILTMMGNSPLDITADAVVQRPIFEQMLTSHPLPDDVRLTDHILGGVPTTAMSIDGADSSKVLLHFHGGWYAIGSPRTAAGLTSDLARRTGTRVESVDYRLAPEHPFPAALEDATAAYLALLDAGTRPEDVIVAGESAGGGIALSLLTGLAGAGLPQPAGAVLISPWTDLTLSGESMTTKVGLDPAFRPEDIRFRVSDYVGNADPADPRISPLFADLTGLPPLFIQTGSYEVLLDDSTRLAARAAGADVQVGLDITPGVPHVFQGYAAMLEEGDAAMTRLARFVTNHLG